MHREVVKLEYRVSELEQQRAELLEALKIAAKQNSHDMLMTGEDLRICEAAITKAEAAE